jgi:hypothetical protein
MSLQRSVASFRKPDFSRLGPPSPEAHLLSSFPGEVPMPSIKRLCTFAVSLLAAIASLTFAGFTLGRVLYFLHCLETLNQAMRRAVKRLRAPRRPVQHESTRAPESARQQGKRPDDLQRFNLARRFSLNSRKTVFSEVGLRPDSATNSPERTQHAGTEDF